ncbi:MAG: aminotransferase class III-fold pyridoxal phosphate-dependent enzyme [Gammaproteobacteria bacterium]|nr:aminotransferase class III-fold pyridoxal phosphate-dependent enzyme [Gammaproteobacteria bacterium]
MTNSVTPRFSFDQISKLLSLHYQCQGELKALESYSDQNLRLTTGSGQFIVKIANSSEPLIELAMQNSAMCHLTSQHIAVPHVIANQQGQLATEIVDQHGNKYCLRLLSYLSGDFYCDGQVTEQSTELWASLGDFVATLDLSCSDFEHPGAYRYLEWDLAQGYRVCQAKKHLLPPTQQKIVEHFLQLYQSQTVHLLGELAQGVIHNDVNDHNILIDDKTSPTAITGLIDFGDMVHSHIINNLAIACAYAIMNRQQPITVMKHIIASYHGVKPLTSTEMSVIYSLVTLRLCTTVCNSALAIAQQPDNQYLSVSVQPAWQLLELFAETNTYAVQCQISEACQQPLEQGHHKAEIIAYRQQHLGKTLSLSYQQPLKIVRGQGAYLFDERGQAYLDMVNNVCHVGHCHPKVVAAGQAQMAKLNTNTRYLHDNLVNYSQKLLATMPKELSVCMFVNSGSEANELAFRLAKNYTSSSQLLVVDGAYHGNTAACIDASPYKFDGPGGEGEKSHVHKVELPDPYRGKYVGNTQENAQAYANSVADVIASLASKNLSPSAFICESLQGVAGQIIMPDGYLSQVYQMVRAAGGVCIADEVQVGFGRVGSHMWAFETQGVIPDIVTLGKPIGNGHPMACVITTPAIAEAFVTGMEYFNTFGGNPVSCAIGLAVLETIEQEQLQQKALTTGQYLRDQLRQLQQQFNLIGDVRGLGLFIGVEMVEDPLTKTPATEQTAWLIEHFKRHFILMSTEGPFYNILKIKPPLAFNSTDADKFIAVLRQGLITLNNE